MGDEDDLGRYDGRRSREKTGMGDVNILFAMGKYYIEERVWRSDGEA
jgi:hypothetical protein